MIRIDGSQGEGGGQILRTALSLSMCLKEPVRIVNIRAGRAKPGLLRQHLTCVHASQAICDAQVKGDVLGSKVIEFIPNDIKAENYHFNIGTAGSTSLVFQTILPALSRADNHCSVLLEGGTHNQQAPSYDFIVHSFLYTLKEMGYQVETELLRYGFYPHGGGQWCAQIKPVDTIKPFQLSDRGELIKRLAVATSVNLPGHVGERELAQVKKKCHWLSDELSQKLIKSHGSGNILSLRLFMHNTNQLFESVGQLGISAERVAYKAIRSMKHYLKSEAAISEYLADQLLLPMALGQGGSFTTIKPSLHTMTNIKVIQQFIDCDIEVNAITDEKYQIIINKK